MARTLLDLARDVEALSDEVAEAANELKQKVALELVKILVFETPVDTSKALSNWRASLGEGLDNAIEAIYPGSHGSTRSASGLEAISRAEAEIKRSKPGETVAIFNAAPHIRRLNEGYSSQAPAGFIEVAVLKAQAIIAKEGLDLKGA